MNSSQFQESISSETSVASATISGPRVLKSRSSTWSSLHLKVVEWSSCQEEFRYRPTRDPLIVTVIGRGGTIECTQGRERRSTHYRDGAGAIIAGGEAGCVRWNLPVKRSLQLAYTYIPRATVTRVENELTATGIAHVPLLRSQPYFDRPVVGDTVKTLVHALGNAQGEFLAQIAAQWLTLQILTPRTDEMPKIDNRRPVTTLRLRRVLEYMEANVAEPLSLEVLARQAGVSRFHFVGMFRQAMGNTPHRHLLELRMRIAASMLLEFDRSILDITLACGFRNPSHFAAAFRRLFAQSPSAYRQQRRSA